MAAGPLARARRLVTELDVGQDEVRLVGGLAVRGHLGDIARESLDIDLVAMNDRAREALLSRLRGEGFAVGASGGWWRAVRETGGSREVVDVTGHPVVNPRTFDTMALRAASFEVEPGLVAVGLDDLVYLKLCAGRDQDLVDLAMLTTHLRPDAAAIAEATRADDVERLVARTVLEARFALARGLLDVSFEELLGRPLGAPERDAFDAFLKQMSDEEGL